MTDSALSWCGRLLRIPPDPEPPVGDEATARVFRASPKFYRYLLFLWALKSLIALGVLLWIVVVPGITAIALHKQGLDVGWLLLPLLIPALALPLVVGLRIFALAVLRLDFEKRWYVVTDRSLRVRAGIFVVREMTVTFANIQNLSIAQGPIQRALGIADLRVETAGGGGRGGGQQGGHPGENLHTAWFRGIDNAETVRELIQRRLRQAKDSGLGDHEELAAARSAAGVPAGTGATPATTQAVSEALGAVLTEATALRIALGRPP